MATETITVRIPSEARNALAQEAERRGCAIADVVRDAVSRHLSEARETDRLTRGFAGLSEEIKRLEKNVLAKLDLLEAA